MVNPCANCYYYIEETDVCMKSHYDEETIKLIEPDCKKDKQD